MPYASILARLRTILAWFFLFTPFWRCSFRHQLGRMFLWLAYAYVGLSITLLIMENWLLFTPLSAQRNWMSPPRELGVEDVALRSSDGDELHGWWSKPEGWRPADGAVLYLHGKGGNVSTRGKAMWRWRETLGQAVLVIDYPGYGRSTGTPTEPGCYAAGEAAYDWLTQTAHVPGHRVVLLGGSLGGGIATELATHRPHRALVLIATFTSFPDMAEKTFPYLPGRWLVHNQLDNLRKIATLSTPVFIAHGTEDGLIPFRQGERLFAAANQPKCFYPMPGRRHTEVPSDDCFPAVRAFLEANDLPAARRD
jgi:uncharacterized protein